MQVTSLDLARLMRPTIEGKYSLSLLSVPKSYVQESNSFYLEKTSSDIEQHFHIHLVVYYYASL